MQRGSRSVVFVFHPEKQAAIALNRLLGLDFDVLAVRDYDRAEALLANAGEFDGIVLSARDIEAAVALTRVACRADASARTRIIYIDASQAIASELPATNGPVNVPFDVAMLRAHLANVRRSDHAAE